MANPVKPVIPGYEPDNERAFDGSYESLDPAVLPLPCLIVNDVPTTVLTRWAVTPQEVSSIVTHGCLWLQIATFGNPMQPVAFRFEPPVIEAADEGEGVRPHKLLWDHELKSWPEYFREVWEGNKPFECRVDDRSIKSGDHLLLREWDPAIDDPHGVTDWAPPVGVYMPLKGYTGRAVIVPTLSILRGPSFGVVEGYCVIGLNLAAMRRFDTWPRHLSTVPEGGEARG